MRRKFEAFNQEVINEEFMALPVKDASALKLAMKRYQNDEAVGYRVKNYGDGLLMIHGSGKDQGRCLFFKKELVADSTTGELRERLVALLIYKKESMEVPARVMETARRRMEDS